MAAKRVLIPDTNVFLSDPNCLNAFPNEMIVIPLEVVEEIDDLKRRVDDVGRNARYTSRMLDDLRVRGNLVKGVKLENGCTVAVMFSDKGMSALPAGLRNNKEDNRILATALAVRESNGEKECVFISKDVNMRIKADALGIKAIDYEGGKIEFEELYSGYCEIPLPDTAIDEFVAKRSIDPIAEFPLSPNEIAVFYCEETDKTAYGRLDPDTGKIAPLKLTMDVGVSGIRPLNPEQLFSLELLLDERLSLITLNGRAGTGKTLIALAAGCHFVLEKTTYDRLLVSRPVVPLGKDLGFLPGSIEEKMDPWMQPLYDNLDLIFSLGASEKKRQKRRIKDLIDTIEQIEIEPLTYIRGRSLPNQFMIVDEAQNLSQHEVKTIITRAGKGTKVVLTGDPYQIDHPYLDTNSNGLNYVVEKFKDSPIAGHITLVKGERSELAELAAELL